MASLAHVDVLNKGNREPEILFMSGQPSTARRPMSRSGVLISLDPTSFDPSLKVRCHVRQKFPLGEDFHRSLNGPTARNRTGVSDLRS